MELSPSDRVRLLRRMESWIGPVECVALATLAKSWFAEKNVSYTGVQLREAITEIRNVAVGSRKYECVLASGGYSIRVKRSAADETGNVNRKSDSRGSK